MQRHCPSPDARHGKRVVASRRPDSHAAVGATRVWRPDASIRNLYNPPENHGSPLASPQPWKFCISAREESGERSMSPRSRTLPGYYTGPAVGQGCPSIVGSVDWLYFRGRSVAGGPGVRLLSGRGRHMGNPDSLSDMSPSADVKRRGPMGGLYKAEHRPSLTQCMYAMAPCRKGLWCLVISRHGKSLLSACSGQAPLWGFCHDAAPRHRHGN